MPGKTGNSCHADIADVAKWLALMWVGQMHLDHRRTDRFDRVMQCNRCVGIGPRIEQHSLGTTGLCLMQPVDQHALMIGLAQIDGKPQSHCLLFQHHADIVERLRPVNLWLTRAEEVEIGAVEDKYAGQRGHELGLSIAGFADQPIFTQPSKQRAAMQDDLPDFSDYIVFVDESGSPTLSPVDPHYPIFVLIFCVVAKQVYAEKIQPAIKRLKFEFFGHDMAVLHAHDIRKPKGDFRFLLNAKPRQRFLARVDEVIIAADFRLIAHVIVKKELLRKYVRPFDPYHIALRMNLEQMSLFLRDNGQANRLTHIIAESRGRTEDRALELEFRRICDPSHDWGMARQFPISATPFELKFVEKKINSAGLQLADLTGQPIGRNYLKPDQPNHAFDIVRTKIFRKIWTFP